jgi:two-component system phosphate regulon sensor histidine kinase PhoR
MRFRETFLTVVVCALVAAAIATWSCWVATAVYVGLGLMAGYWRCRDEWLRIEADEVDHDSDNDQSDDRTRSTRLSTVLSSMIEAVIAVDNSERILFANPAAGTVFETGIANVAGRPIWEVIRNPTVQNVVREALAGTGQVVECEIPRTKSIVSIVSTPLDGEPCPGAVLVMHDVTQLRRLEAIRRDFVSNVSHELKTPLTVIQACTDTLLDGAIDDEKYNRTFLQRIADQSERLHRLIMDLLQLGRIESAATEFDFIDLDLGELICGCLVNHESIADLRGIRLSSEIGQPSPIIQADRETLLTILGNLVDNAIRYSSEGDRVLVECESIDSKVTIRVCDSGPGIPADHVERIFERFYRVDRARSRDMGGTGLGLSIVKHLTQILGGTVVCESRMGEGSTFVVTLPSECSQPTTVGRTNNETADAPQ